MLKIILYLTYLFRFYLAAIIGAFIIERTGSSQQTFFAVGITVLIVMVDFLFTLLRIANREFKSWLYWIGRVYKIALIVILLVYAVSIWQSTHYWWYSAFGVFVALLFGLDFLLITRKKPTNLNEI